MDFKKQEKLKLQMYAVTNTDLFIQPLCPEYMLLNYYKDTLNVILKIYSTEFD